MRQARVYGIAGLAVLVLGAAAFAQSTAVPLAEEAPIEVASLEDNAVAALADTQWGDAQRGATIAGTCAACHGLDGNSVVRDIYPSIAGQNEPYMAHQLALFKSGERQSPIMQPFAQMLSPQDMRDVGAYYASQSAQAGIADDGVVTTGDYEGMKFYEVGQQLYRRGDASRQVPACMACHGPTGAGMPGPSYPHVGGQPAWYTARRLQEFREGTTSERDSRLFQVMHAIAEPLADEEIQALASYIEGLHPRPDAATRAQMAQLQAGGVPPETRGTHAGDGRMRDPGAEIPAGAPGSPEASGIDAGEAPTDAGANAPAGDAPATDAPAEPVQQQ